MEVLAQFGDERQKKQWLEPLLAGEIRSAFAMTEPDVASSDATNITTHIRREGDEYVITGRKWYISGAMHPDCAIFIVMGKTDPDGPDIRGQQSMVAPGVTVKWAMRVFGYEDHYHGGHAEVIFDEARVPVSNLIGEEAAGSPLPRRGSVRAGSTTCMRLIGMAERAIELMCRRAVSRDAFGKALAQQGVVQNWIADARVASSCWLPGAEDRLDDGHRRQPGRAHRDPGHQDRHPAHGRRHPRPGDRAVRRGRGRARTSRWPSCTRARAR
ncbi:hypothetical protein SALBM217S_03207 [Streptomyces griseoloalbus]